MNTNSELKNEIKYQWNENPCGHNHADNNYAPETLEWFKGIENHRYKEYAPWKHKVYKFDSYSNKKILEIGGGLGTDLSQFAKNGAEVTDLDFSKEHLRLAKKNFEVRGLKGNFILGDAENFKFEENTFDLVYSNGVIHHTPNPTKVIENIYYYLKKGGEAKCMFYAESSINFYLNLFYRCKFLKDSFNTLPVPYVLSTDAELSENDAAPIVEVYSKERLKELFKKFKIIKITQHQLIKNEIPSFLRFIPTKLIEKFFGWNYVIHAIK